MSRPPTPGPPRRGRWARAAVVLALALIGFAGCATTKHEGLDVAQLPQEVRPDYTLFARRCSKCHSLARPLNSGIVDDEVWVAYVNKMRRQPGSGISPQDTAPILRFLHFYSGEQRRLKRMHDEANGGSAPPADPSGAGAGTSQVSNQTANR